jgi:hypothetical protein
MAGLRLLIRHQPTYVTPFSVLVTGTTAELEWLDTAAQITGMTS